MHTRESVTEKGGQKKQRNSVKLGFAGEERVTEEGGHRHATVVWGRWPRVGHARLQARSEETAEQREARLHS